MITIQKIFKVLVLDDQYGKINSHWSYSTSDLQIVDRVYYDDDDFLRRASEIIKNASIDAIGFSGRGAPGAAIALDAYIKDSKVILTEYCRIPKLYKLHNTNLNISRRCGVISKDQLCVIGNDWVRAVFVYPFDAIMVQTYGDAEIFNLVLKKNTAFWFPYCYNDKLFYPRESSKKLDIGAYCKLERHSHRIGFIEKVENIANEKGFTFEFSDEFWGEEYAVRICRSKVMIHLSYCGDIPWRLYECAASKTCFLTDPLGFNVENLFRRTSYIEYRRDFQDLDSKIVQAVGDVNYRMEVIKSASNDVALHTWEEGVKTYLLPVLRNLCSW